MTSQEMMHTIAKPGYWFVNVAPLGSVPDWREHVQPLAERGLLFGYEEKAFLLKQYK